MTTPKRGTRLLGMSELPRSLTLVRHAQSVANVADQEARRRGAGHLDIDIRDADVELSENGRRQADALARWFAEADPDDRPTLVVSSPYRRAFDTARRVVGDTGVELIADERLRERDLGVLDGLTGKGIREEYADEAARRKKVGKFYYQPPSGESWADVVLRVRSFLSDLEPALGTAFPDARIWVFTHQAVIMSFRYILEALSEPDLLEIDREVDIGNVSLTTYERTEDGLTLTRFADASVVEDAEAEVTHEASSSEVREGADA
jgi:broad specificity phosphatase PhoE